MSVARCLDQGPRGIRFDNGPTHLLLLTAPTVDVQRACHDRGARPPPLIHGFGFRRGLTKRHCGRTE